MKRQFTVLRGRFALQVIMVGLLLSPVVACCQFSHLPLNQVERSWYENDLQRQAHDLHTAILPWRTKELTEFNRKGELQSDSIMKTRKFWNWVQRKLWQENFIAVRGEDYHLTFNPVAVFSLGRDTEADYDDTFRNTRGIRIEGALGDHFSFYSTVVETQARFPFYVTQFVADSRVAPGYWLRKGFRNSAFDFAYAAGEVAYTPNKTFHFRLGHAKQFLGEGYRSLFISDNTVNYPFFRIETQFWKIKYVNTWAIMNDIRSSVMVGDVFAKKYLSMHYLSVNITPRLNVGLFEGIMWGDELNRYGFDVNFLNPVILYRPVEFAQGADGGNTLMGLSAAYRFPFGITAYGQLAIDEFTFSAIRVWGEGDWRNMLSGQLGAKYGDAFGIRNLFLQVEYNAARPYIYSHRDVITNWGHYNQPLAHPWGANFEEFIFRGHYRVQRWLWQFAFHTGRLGRDTRDTNWGGDIYKPNVERTVDTGVFIGQGVKSRLVFWSVDLSYILNPQYNLRLQTGFRYRNEAVAEGGFPDSRYFYFGLSTDVYHSYQDF